MTIHEALQKLARDFSGKLGEKQGIHTFTVTLAERKGFLRKDRLEYIARFRLDEATKTLHFSEMLREQGSGVSSGEDIQGFGFKKEVTRTTSRPRSGTIEEHSRLFGTKYEYRFNYEAIRKAFEALAREHGYGFEYHTAFESI